MAKRIKLSGVYFTTVDDEDFDYLNQFNWSYHHGYARRNILTPNPKFRTTPEEKRYFIEIVYID